MSSSSFSSEPCDSLFTILCKELSGLVSRSFVNVDRTNFLPKIRVNRTAGRMDHIEKDVN